MRAQRLTENIKVGYPVFKESAGVPSWLVPVRSMEELAEELGDTGILSLGSPLDIGTGFNSQAESAAGPLSLSPDDWQSAFVAYPYRHLVGPVMEALLEVTSRIAGQIERIRFDFDPQVIANSIAVLAMAPFVEAGKHVLEKVSEILAVDASEPADILRSYGQAVLSGDVFKANAVSDCIGKYPAWTEWLEALRSHIQNLNHHPKVIGVTPPVSPELTGVLVTMLKERESR